MHSSLDHTNRSVQPPVTWLQGFVVAAVLFASVLNSGAQTLVGSPLIDRVFNDGAAGQVYLYSVPSGAVGVATSFQFYDNEAGSRRITPLIFEKLNASQYVLRGVGASITTNGAGTQNYPFSLIAGTNVMAANYTFGFTDREVSYGGSGSEITTTASYTGTVDFDTSGPTEWLFTPSLTFELSLGQAFDLGGLLYNGLDSTRTYSAQILISPATPTVISISPTSGSTTGGTSVTINGTNFTGATGVTIGGSAATSVSVVNATTITCTTPAGSAGTASVVVTTPSGSNAANAFFTYTNAAPTDIALSAASIAENVSAGSTVGSFSTTDPDAGNTFTYTLVSGTGSTDNTAFTITGNALSINASPNFEAKSSYGLRVRSTDQGGLFFEKQFTVTITNVNEMPTDIALSAASIAENVSAGSTVGTFSTTDQDAGNTFTYSLAIGTGSTDNASFTITGNTLSINASPNFEAKSSYGLRVRSTDQGGMSFEKQFTVNITDENEAPTDIALSPASIAENNAPNATVGMLSTTDVDAGATFTYALVAGTGSTDNGAFTINGNALRLTAGADFETKNSYALRVRSTDQGALSFEKEFTVTVSNVNDAPVAVADAFATPTDIARTISAADLVANDTDQDVNTLTVTSVQSPTNGASVSLNAGMITYTPAAAFTGTATFTYSISDGAGGTANGTVTMTVNGSAPVVLNDSMLTITEPMTITNPVTLSGTGGLETTEEVMLMGPVTVTGNPTIDTTSMVTIEGPIDGAGELEKKGPGTLNLMGASTFTGGFKATAGEVGIGHDEALGEGKVTLGGGTLSAMTELKVIGNEVQIDANTTIKGMGLGIAGDVVMNGSRAIETIGSLDISGNVSDMAGKTAAITKVGDGDLILAGDNTFSGGVMVMEGTLGIASDTAAGTGKVMLGGGTLEAVDGDRQISNPVEVMANTKFTGETLTLDGPTQINGTPMMDLQADVNLTDKVTNSNPSVEACITKEGPAALTLTETSSLEVPIVVQDGDVNANGVTTAEVVLAIPVSARDPLDEGKHSSQSIVNGLAAVSFFEEINDDLKYQIASDADATTWEVAVTVDSTGDVGQFTSLAVVNGNPAISYYDSTNGDLKFVRALNASGSTWGTPITVASAGDVGQYTSLLVVNGNPAIAYYDETNGDLKYVRASDASGSAWGTPVSVHATGDVGQYASMKVVSGFPAIAFHDVTNGDLLYSRASNADGSAWGGAVIVEDAGIVGAYASLCVVDGRPAISYFDATEDLVTTSNSALHLCYIRSSDATGSTWPASAVIVDDSSRNVGHYTSLQVVNGHPAISYQDFEAENLKYAWSDDAQGGVWPDEQKVIVEEVGQVGTYSSLQVVNGKPGISFYDDTRDDIEHKVFAEVPEAEEVVAPPPAFFDGGEGLFAAPPPSSAAAKAASAKAKTSSRAARGSKAKNSKKGGKKGAKANKKKPRKTGKNGKSKKPKKPQAAGSSSQVTQSGATLPKVGKTRVPEMLKSGSTLSIAGAKTPVSKKPKGSSKGGSKKKVTKLPTGVGSKEIQEDFYIEGGATWDWDIATASGPKGKKGIGWDYVKVGGDLEIAAAASAPISIKLRPSSASKLGKKELKPFNRMASYEWEILRVGGTISGFDPDHFRLSLDPVFKKIAKGGSFELIQVAKTLRIAYTPPVAPPPGEFAFAPPPPLEEGPLPPPGLEPDIAIQKDLGAVNLTSGSLTPVDFGGVNTGATQTLTFTLSNTGAADLTDLDYMIDGTDSIDFRVIEFPTDVLTPGATAPVVIQFEPSASGSRSAMLNVLSNDPDEAPFEINLSGTGNPATEIAVASGGADLADGATAPVDYGLVSVNSTKDVTFTVSNIGSLDLTGLTVTLDGANADQFSITAPLAVNSLVSGDSAIFTVRFAPMTSGVKTAAIHIPSNDADESSFDINLTGEGAVAPEIAVELASADLYSGETIDAGAVATGGMADLTFTIKNLGSASLTGLAASFSGTNAANFSVVTPASASVNGGGSTTLTIRFAPTASGPKSAVLQIANNDADESPFVVRLSSITDHEVQSGTISTILAGNVDFIKSGPGSAELTGANSFTGNTMITGGILTLGGTPGGNNALPTNGTAGDNDIFINGGSLQIGGSEQIGDNAGIVLSTGSFGFSGSGLTETIGTFANNGGTFSTGANTLIGTGNTITWNGGTNTINAGGTLADTHYSVTGGTNTVQGGATRGTLHVQGGGLGLEFDGTGSPTITLNSDAAQAGRILLEGNVNVLSGLTSGTAQILNGGAAANSGFIDMNGGTRTFTVANGSAATDLLISAVITNGGLTKDGAGTLALNGANTYTGATTVSAGTLSINASGALGTGGTLNLGVASTSSGTLTYTGGIGTINKNINALGNGTDTIENTGSGLLTLSGTIAKNGTTLTLKGGASGISVTGNITGISANSDLIVDGGIVTLAAANSYNGPTFIRNSGTLNANAANALPTLNGRTAVTFDGTGTSVLSLGANQAVASLASTGAATVSLNANILTVGAAAGSVDFAGSIGGTGGLTKDLAGTQILSGSNG